MIRHIKKPVQLIIAVARVDMALLSFGFLVLLLSGSGVFCDYDESAPVWSDASDENTVVPKVNSRAGDGFSEDDRILEIFNECECVMYYLCGDDNYIITDGRGILTPRLKPAENVTRLACKTEFHFCCKVRPNKTETQTDRPSIRNPTLPFPTDRPNTPPKCGVQKPILNQRILTKEPSTIPGEFPWMVAILNQKSRGRVGYDFKCAGSIIHPRVILTAAHCVRRANLDYLQVVYNVTHELDVLYFGPKYYRKSVVKVVLHKDFYSGGLYNDVALLVLESAMELDGFVNSICIPQQSEVFNSTDCWAAGWGESKSGENSNIRYLRKVKIPMVPHGQCEIRLKTTRLGPDFTLHESFVCAGGVKNEDTCYGDGGGPLVCPINYGKYTQIGIVSWGVGCGQDGIPGVYTNVALFRDWIEEELRKEGLGV